MKIDRKRAIIKEMKDLYDVQEWLKKYGYLNLDSNRRDAIYFMQTEVKALHAQGILADNDKDYLTARLILKREAAIEEKNEGK